MSLASLPGEGHGVSQLLFFFFYLELLFCICDYFHEFNWDRELGSGLLDSFLSKSRMEK